MAAQSTGRSAVRILVEADLAVSVEVPGAQAVTAHLTGSGSALSLTVSDPHLFAGRKDSAAVRALAESLSGQGVTITVVTPAGPLVTLGAPRAPWWQRPLTGSQHIRIERVAALWSLARGRARAGGTGALPSAALVPPTTVWPLAPTFLRRPRRVTTTHDPSRGGNPRLVMAPRPDPWPGDVQSTYPLRGGATTIGSDAGCDVVLPGLEPVHAEVRHDDRDEFVLVRRAGTGVLLVNGAPVMRALLRTATRIEMGSWTMSFYREEYADHGRPYGGRVGGEIGHQRPQPRQPRTHVEENE